MSDFVDSGDGEWGEDGGSVGVEVNGPIASGAEEEAAVGLGGRPDGQEDSGAIAANDWRGGEFAAIKVFEEELFEVVF